MILGQNLVFVRKSQTIFSIRNVLENHDLGKRHKIWAKLHCPPNFFGWYAYIDQGWDQNDQLYAVMVFVRSERSGRTGPSKKHQNLQHPKQNIAPFYHSSTMTVAQPVCTVTLGGK